MVAEPVKVRFSTFAPRVRLMLDCTVSISVARAAGLDYCVSRISNQVGVVAQTTGQCIGTAIAGEDITQSIAGTVDVGRTG